MKTDFRVWQMKHKINRFCFVIFLKFIYVITELLKMVTKGQLKMASFNWNIAHKKVFVCIYPSTLRFWKKGAKRWKVMYIVFV